jgi:hypothetical protein
MASISVLPKAAMIMQLLQVDAALRKARANIAAMAQ